MSEKEYGSDAGSRRRSIGEIWRNRRRIKHPLLVSLLISIAPGCLGTLAVSWIYLLPDVGYSGINFPQQVANSISSSIFIGILVGVFLIYPWVLTAIEVYLAVTDRDQKDTYREERYRKCKIFDIITIPLGIVCSALYLQVLRDVVFDADWGQVLYNAQRHTPIYTRSAPTIVIIAFAGYAGYLTVNCFVPLEKTPPLIPVLGIAAMYLGTAESIFWGIQVYSSKELMDVYLWLLPVNCVIITARTVRHKVWEWRQLPHEEPAAGSFWGTCNRLLIRSESWPFAAFLLMWPLLGILVVLLLLIGQKPDAIIEAFTQTADWNLSRRVAPQNVMYDEHYLCTVAAGGHKKVVKPLRLGVRHGHEVIVNRQLCVANAFEQILEEKTPRFHRAVRRFYDTYGFPVARLIRSKYAADLIYFLMKPLEWLFLAVLYLTDVKPENRIALQYTGKSVRDFSESGSQE